MPLSAAERNGKESAGNISGIPLNIRFKSTLAKIRHRIWFATQTGFYVQGDFIYFPGAKEFPPVKKQTNIPMKWLQSTAKL